MHKIFDIFDKIQKKTDKQKEIIKNSLVIERFISDNITIGISRISMEMIDNVTNDIKKTNQALQLKYNEHSKLFGLFAFTSYNNSLSYDFVNYEDNTEYARLLLTYIPPNTFNYFFSLYKLNSKTRQFVYVTAYHGVMKNYKTISMDSVEFDKITEFMKQESS